MRILGSTELFLRRPAVETSRPKNDCVNMIVDPLVLSDIDSYCYYYSRSFPAGFGSAEYACTSGVTPTTPRFCLCFFFFFFSVRSCGWLAWTRCFGISSSALSLRRRWVAAYAPPPPSTLFPLQAFFFLSYVASRISAVQWSSCGQEAFFGLVCQAVGQSVF